MLLKNILRILTARTSWFCKESSRQLLEQLSIFGQSLSKNGKEKGSEGNKIQNQIKPIRSTNYSLEGQNPSFKPLTCTEASMPMILLPEKLLV